MLPVIAGTITSGMLTANNDDTFDVTLTLQMTQPATDTLTFSGVLDDGGLDNEAIPESRTLMRLATEIPLTGLHAESSCAPPPSSVRRANCTTQNQSKICAGADQAEETLRNNPRISMILCGVHFDESRMYDLLRYAKREHPRTPFVCVRVLDAEIPRVSREALRIAAESMGATRTLICPPSRSSSARMTPKHNYGARSWHVFRSFDPERVHSLPRLCAGRCYHASQAVLYLVSRQSA
jgi:hypothetical protein